MFWPVGNLFNPASLYTPDNPLNPAHRANPTTLFAPFTRSR